MAEITLQGEGKHLLFVCLTCSSVGAACRSGRECKEADLNLLCNIQNNIVIMQLSGWRGSLHSGEIPITRDFQTTAPHEPHPR